MNLETRNRIVEENLALAVSFARKYWSRGMEDCDLEQEAFVALIEAVETWDPERGKLSTHLGWQIKRRFTHLLRYRDALIPTGRSSKKVKVESIDFDPCGHGPLIEIMDEQEEPAERLTNRMINDTVHDCLKLLTDRDAIVIRMRRAIGGGNKFTLREVSVLLGVTPERVRQIQRAAEGKLLLIMRQRAILKEYCADRPGT